MTITPEQLRTSLNGEHLALCCLPDGTVTTTVSATYAVFPGSFHPLHAGHRGLAQAVEQRLGVPVHFEISLTNVDKPDLDLESVLWRVHQFHGVAPVWLTRAARFSTKAELFPNTVFVLGYDTARRLVDPRYYGNDITQRDAALRTLRDAGCRAIVGGRLEPEGSFQVWDATLAPMEFQPLFQALTEAEFRVDLSSSAIRQRASDRKNHAINSPKPE
ncbi:MAG: hypothetical protein LC104_08765 [Bacteroidales bacterium]|nr:hypothetical protein [Bacteroidales bacterium]